MFADRIRFAPLVALLCVALAAAMAAAVAVPAEAQTNGTVTVTRGDDPDPGPPGQCGDVDDDSRDDCSLRQAVRLANDDGDVNEIVIDVATVELTIGGGNNDDASWGDLDITSSVTIRGVGTPTIDASGMMDDGFPVVDRVFDVHGPDVSATFEGMVITGGHAQAGGGPGGGAIRAVDASLTLDRVEARDNEAEGSGGAIYVIGWIGTVDFTAVDTQITGNRTGADGGGILFDYGSTGAGTIDLQRVELRDNLDENCCGGGLSLLAGSATDVAFSMSDSAVTDNTVTGCCWGGGVSLSYPGSVNRTWTITDTVISGNVAPAQGGGLAVFAGGGMLEVDLLRTQVVDNHAVGGGAGGDFGGGIYTLDTALTLTDSVVANNSVLAEDGRGGGGVYANGNPAPIETPGEPLERDAVTAINSTFSGNAAVPDEDGDAHGGGVYLFGASGSFHHVTFADNSAPDGGDAIYLDAMGGDTSATLTATALAGGDSTRCTGTFNGSSAFIDNGGNVADDSSCQLDPGDVHPDLGLADLSTSPRYDMPDEATLVHLLEHDSPAIGAVDAELCLATDQRGVPRPQDGTTPCASGAVEFVALADLVLSKDASVTSAEVGDRFTYTIEVTNHGPETAPAVVVTDDLPAEVRPVAAEASAGSCAIDDQALTCTIGDLPVGSSATVTVTADAVAEGTAVNTASATHDGLDPDPQSATDSATVTVVDDLPLGVLRLAGPERIATAVEVSRQRFGDGAADAAVLARAEEFADALAATPLAVKENGPLLLTHPHTLDPLTAAEIQRVLPAGGTVYVIGGTVAISTDVADELAAMGYDVIRLGGEDRFATAVQIAEEGIVDPEVLLLATGFDFADALAGGAAAGVSNGAVLLTAGTDMAPATQAYIDANPELDRFALGGPAASADADAVGLVGPTRFETSIAVVEEFFDDPAELGVAQAFEFPDALTGGAHISARGGPVVLTSPDVVPGPLRSYLTERVTAPERLWIYGGTVAISEAVADELTELLR